jgi:predicted RNA-binding protein YlqC (UPF0109 family)
MKELIRRIAESLVDQPDRISVTEKVSETTIFYELEVTRSDIGKIIGKHGKNINAIRTILKAIAGKTRKQILLELAE